MLAEDSVKKRTDLLEKLIYEFLEVTRVTVDAMSAISGASLTSIVTDTSQVDIDAVTQGKVSSCVNAGLLVLCANP